MSIKQHLLRSYSEINGHKNMGNMKKHLLTLSLSFAILFSTNAQKVVGYIDANLNQAGTRIPQMHWDKLTDFIYGFMQPDGSGNLPDPTSLNHFSTIKTYCDNNNVNMHFSSGGATYSSIFNTIGSNATATSNYAKEIADILENYGLNGWDLDWEFPRTAQEQINQVNILKAVHDEFTARGKRDEWTIAIAVGGETPSVGAQSVYHTDYCSVNAFQYLDYLNIMSYDIGYSISGNDFNHSSYADAQANVVDWVNKGCPIEKIVLGVPFYGRHKTSRYAGVYGTTYGDLSTADPATAYNSNNVGDYYYNGKPLLTQKVDYIMNQGGAGIMIWEVTYDRFDQYSLLDALAAAMAPYQCSAPQPDLGADKTICGSSSLTLNSGVATAPNRTFTWKKGTQTLVNNSASKNTQSITSAGIYTVSVNENGCSNTDEIEVLGNLPAIDLGGDQDLCSPSMLTLDAGVSGNVNYSWTKDGNPLSQNEQTITIHKGGAYALTVSDKGGVCADVSDQVIISSSLIDVDDESLCNPGSTTITINENNGTYNWFSDLEGGNSINTGTTYSTSISSSTYFYIELESTGGENCVGLATYNEGDVVASATDMIWEGEKWRNKWWVNKSPTVSPSEWDYLGSCSGIALCDRTPVLAHIETCTGLNNSNFKTIEASPNPTSSNITVSFNQTLTGTVSILNMSGQNLIQQQVNNVNKTNIDVNELKNGIYLLQILSDKENQTLRIIKN